MESKSIMTVWLVEQRSAFKRLRTCFIRAPRTSAAAGQLQLKYAHHKSYPDMNALEPGNFWILYPKSVKIF